MPKRVLSATASLVAGVALLAFALWLNYRDLVHPYTWDNDYQTQASADGWERFHDLKAGDLVLPWTWFWPPSANLSFARRDLLARDAPYAATWVLHFRRDDKGSIEEGISAVVVDCDRDRFGIIRTTPLDLAGWTWQTTVRGHMVMFEVAGHALLLRHPSEFVTVAPTDWSQAPESYRTFFCEHPSPR